MTRAIGKQKYKGRMLPWRNTGIQVEGPAVTDAQKLFLQSRLRQNDLKHSFLTTILEVN